MSVFGVVLVRIFSHLDWIWRDTESECGKIRTRITPNIDTFHAVIIKLFKNWLNWKRGHSNKEDFNYLKFKDIQDRDRVLLFRLAKHLVISGQYLLPSTICKTKRSFYGKLPKWKILWQCKIFLFNRHLLFWFDKS